MFDDAQVKTILNAIKDDVLDAAKAVMINKGVPKRSDLIKSMDFEVRDNNLVLVANDYYLWLSTGRKRGARKVPIAALLSWIKDYRIKGRSRTSGRFITNNQLAFAIQTSIYKNGIKGRKYADKVDEITTEILAEQLAEQLSIGIADGIANAFNKN